MPKVQQQESVVKSTHALCLGVSWNIYAPFLPHFLFTEYKRARQEIKRKSLDTIKLQKKARKGEETVQGMLSNQNLEI